MIHFYVYRAPKRPKPKIVKYPAVFLFDDSWDDYGYKTLFSASIQIDKDSEEVDLGELKILEISRSGVVHSPNIDDRFTELSTTFCSLGQSVRYYRRLRDDLPTSIRRQYLRGIRDIVSLPKQRERFQAHEGFETSLLRSGGARDALRQGGYYIGYPTEEPPAPQFSFVMSLPAAQSPHAVAFDFTQHEGLPHRINLLIGRNGTGKTQLLANLAQSLYGGEEIEGEETARHGTAEIIGAPPDFAKIIAISYSAFDQFPIPKRSPRHARKSLFDYKYCGLRNAAGIIDVGELRAMLSSAMKAVESEDRGDILRKLLDQLLGPSNGR